MGDSIRPKDERRFGGRLWSALASSPEGSEAHLLSGIVAIEAAGPSSVTLYRRFAASCSPASVQEQVEPSRPFLVLSDQTLLEGLPCSFELEALSGSGAFSMLLSFSSWTDQAEALKHLRQRTGKSLADLDCPFAAPGDAVLQYLMRSGQRLFRGMAFDDLVRMQLDLEVWYPDGAAFPNAAKASDRIVAIALSDSTGWEEVLAGQGIDEASLIQLAVQRIMTRDPDVIEGHNLFRFDLPYLEARARLHGVPLLLGRDGSRLRETSSRVRIGPRVVQHPRYRIHGRHVVDTMLLAMEFDSGVFPLDGLSLKELGRRFGVVPPDRTYIDGDKIRDVWKTDPDRFLAYALDDVRETRAISKIMLEPSFWETQQVPVTFQGLHARPMTTRLELMFWARHLQSRVGIPARDAGLEPRRHPWVEPKAGLFERVIRVELRALPAAMHLHRKMTSPQDPLGLFGQLESALQHTLAEERVGRAALLTPEGALLGYARRLAEATGDLLRMPGSHFADARQARLLRDAVQALLQHWGKLLEQQRAVVLSLNDVGGLIQLPPGQEGLEAGQRLLMSLSRGCPPGVTLSLLDYHPRLLLQKDGQQAFLSEDDQLVVVGTGLRSRTEAPVIRTLQEGVIRCLLQGRPQEARAQIMATLEAVRSGTLPLSEFVRRDPLRESPDAYRIRNNPGGSRWPAYEAALRAGLTWMEGEQVRWYVSVCAGSSPSVAEHAGATLVSKHGAPNTAIHLAWYAARITALLTKLEPFFVHAS